MSEFRLGSSDGLVKDGISFVIVRKKIVERNFLFLFFSAKEKLGWRVMAKFP